MMSIGRKIHCPNACTAGTLSAIIAMTSPSPMKANDTAVNATNKSTGYAGIVIPTASATPSCSSPADSKIT